jgi:hypothetical protein
LFTVQQLQAIGADLPQVALAPQGQQGLGWLKTFDLKLSYPRKFGENFTVEPSVSVFNAFNNANFDLPSSTIGGTLNLASSPCTPGAPPSTNNCNGTVNSTTSVEHNLNRVLPGSGVFDLGAPRVVEFGLKLIF